MELFLNAIEKHRGYHHLKDEKSNVFFRAPGDLPGVVEIEWSTTLKKQLVKTRYRLHLRLTKKEVARLVDIALNAEE